MRVRGKVAIVTGAASGVGEATARRFAAEGAAVIAGDLDADRLRHVTSDIEATGGTVLPFDIDVTQRDRIDACVAAARQHFGGLDILVNNAGMSSAAGMDPTNDVWEAGLATTLSSAYWMSKVAVDAMLGRAGAIVNISSLAGNEMGTPVAWYCSAKAGMVGLTRSFATTYGPKGIRTNAICLGAIDTPRIRTILDKMPGQQEVHDKRSPLGRMGKPEEIAACALFLASDEASYVNGHALVADGGWSQN